MSPLTYPEPASSKIISVTPPRPTSINPVALVVVVEFLGPSKLTLSDKLYNEPLEACSSETPAPNLLVSGAPIIFGYESVCSCSIAKSVSKKPVSSLYTDSSVNIIPPSVDSNRIALGSNI